jgi:hypothetical protein
VTARTTLEKWGLIWHSLNTLEGERRLIMFDRGKPLLFRTRREARAYAETAYGYIKKRPDLRQEPHGWRFPRAVRVRVTFEEHGR